MQEKFVKMNQANASEGVRNIGVEVNPGEKESEVVARVILNPLSKASATMIVYESLAQGLQGDYEFADLIGVLNAKVGKTLRGKKLEESQEMLAAQAHTLDAIFNVMARRAACHLGERVDFAETYLKLALRAQSQCRSTLEALNEIKNPKLANVVRQANIAGGHQQVNNYPGVSHTEEIEKQPNELLEDKQHERVDFGAPAAPGGINTPVEAVGTVERPKKRSRKKKGMS